MADGFHRGELLVQRQAGVRAAAARLAGMLSSSPLSGGMSRFAAERDLAILTSGDDEGLLWTSPLYGRPGFCTAEATMLRIAARPVAGDPLAGLRAGRPAGTLLIDFAKRRRLRVNGTLARVEPDLLEIAVEQAYGNCPRYIRPRRTTRDGAVEREGASVVSDGLDADAVALVERADMFVLGTTHPTHGADASHRGGEPGFVRVDGDGQLWWPDYPGNNLFNSLGNIVEDPRAAMLFFDFAAGVALQLSGRAAIEWGATDIPDDEAGTGRRVRFTPHRTVRTVLPLRLLA